MTYAGISTITIENILEDVALALVEPIVNTNLGTKVTIQNVSSTVTPGSMVGIYIGAVLLVGLNGDQEQVTVTAVTATTFTAVFEFPHAATDPVVGSTFPSGQTDHPLFTQDEIFGYLADVQNDFLLKTRCIFGVTGTFLEPPNIPLSNGVRYYSQPPQAVRLERLAGSRPSGFQVVASVVVDEDFATQPNQDPITGNWSVFDSTDNVLGQILGGLFIGQANSSCDMLYDDNTIDWSANQAVSGTLEALVTGTGDAWLFVRGQLFLGPNDEYNGYAAGLISVPASPFPGGMGQRTEFQITSAENTLFTGSLIPNPGDIFTFAVVDEVLYFFQNNVLIVMVNTDGSSESGLPGISAEPVLGPAGSVAWSTFSAGVATVSQSSLSFSPGGSSFYLPVLVDLYETTQSDLDAENGNWEVDAGSPAQWFRDNIDSSKFGVYPLPNSGGTLELWYSKRGLLGNAANFFLAETLLIPDVMSHYIKYGVLSRCWSKDGESHDPLRAEYCKKRYELGIVLVQRFMEGIGIQAQPKTPQTFSPMAISREPAEVTGG